jgi:hypothetical protein
MVPSSSIAFTVDGERLTCSGFSLGKPIHLGNFEFIADYFGSLSLSPRRGNEGTIFVGSTHSGASTPAAGHDRGLHRGYSQHQAGKEALGTLPSDGAAQWGAHLPLTATTWKESAPTTMGFPPWTPASCPETYQPSEQRHTHRGSARRVTLA